MELEQIIVIVDCYYGINVLLSLFASGIVIVNIVILHVKLTNLTKCNYNLAAMCPHHYILNVNKGLEHVS